MPNFIRHLDMIGLRFNFLIDGKEMYQTKTGGYLTIASFICFAALFFSLGIDLYLRTNPRVLFNSAIMGYEEVPLSNKNFTYAYRIEDPNGAIIMNDSVLAPHPNYFLYKLDKDGVWQTQFYRELERKRCGELPYAEEKEKAYNISLANWFCIDFDNLTTMGGNWDGNFVYGLQIDTKQCQNSTENNNTCLPYGDMVDAFVSQKTTSNFFYSFLYLEGVPALGNYYSPLTTTIVNTYAMLNMNITKRIIQVFKQMFLENDIGWIYQIHNNTSINCVDSTVSDFTFKNPSSQPILFTYIMYFGKKYDKYTRAYVKLQEVLATIGGFMKVLTVVIYLFYLSLSTTYKNKVLFDTMDFEGKAYVKSNLHSQIIVKNNHEGHRHQIDKKYQKSEAQDCESPETKSKMFGDRTDVNETFRPKIMSIELGEKGDFNMRGENNMRASDEVTSRTINMLSKADIPPTLTHPKKPLHIVRSNPSIYKISLCFMFKDRFCIKNRSAREKYAYDCYHAHKGYIEDICNIRNYLKIQSQFQTLKNVLLNTGQVLAVDFIQPTSIDPYEYHTADNDTKSFEIMAEYFALRKQKLFGVNKKLYDMLHDEYKCFISEEKER